MRTGTPTLAPQRLRLARQRDVLIPALLARDAVGRPRHCVHNRVHEVFCVDL